eukprot:SM000133S26813  [mRNA]  locus=s133:241174:242377:- [translate_table: standard]
MAARVLCLICAEAPGGVPPLLPPAPDFGPASAAAARLPRGGRAEFRKVFVPAHRYSPLRQHWMDIYAPVYERMKIDIRMNLKVQPLPLPLSCRCRCRWSHITEALRRRGAMAWTSRLRVCGTGFRTHLMAVSESPWGRGVAQSRKVELKTRKDTEDASALQKCADFVHAFVLGFDVADAIALLRLDDLYVESFEIKDVKTLRGEHLSRAIGRLSGKGGKTKFAVENATKTRIVIADQRIHLLGSFAHVRAARDALCSLILGSPAGKVYSKLRAVSGRLGEV